MEAIYFAYFDISERNWIITDSNEKHIEEFSTIEDAIIALEGQHKEIDMVCFCRKASSKEERIRQPA